MKHRSNSCLLLVALPKGKLSSGNISCALCACKFIMNDQNLVILFSNCFINHDKGKFLFFEIYAYVISLKLDTTEGQYGA